MKRTLWIGGALLAASSLLVAYGVSPSQYTNNQNQNPSPGAFPNAPAPNPVPGNAIAPGGAMANGQPIQFQANPQTQPVDYSAVPDWAKAWKHYDWNEAKAAWESRDGLFIDARAKMEYDQSHIPGAIPMPVGEFDTYYEKYKSKIKSAKFLITYCHGAGCQLSNKVAQKLYNDKGYKNVGSFFGGWPQWQQHNMPVESGPEPKR